MDTDAPPPDEQANAGLWIMSVGATVVNVGLWHGANAGGSMGVYPALAWLLVGLPCLLAQVFVLTPWLLSRIRSGIGASRPGLEARVALALPAVALASMAGIFMIHA